MLLTCWDVSSWKWLTGRCGSKGRMELRNNGGHEGTSPASLDCSSRFTKACFCGDFISELWSLIAISLERLNKKSWLHWELNYEDTAITSIWSTYTLSLTMREAGKVIMSETDMYGINWERSMKSSGVTRGNLWMKAAVMVSMASCSFGETCEWHQLYMYIYS